MEIWITRSGDGGNATASMTRPRADLEIRPILSTGGEDEEVETVWCLRIEEALELKSAAKESSGQSGVKNNPEMRQPTLGPPGLNPSERGGLKGFIRQPTWVRM